MQEHSVALTDGRILACAEYGDPSSSRVLVVNHGTGSCRLENALYDEVFAEFGLRVLAPERPGYGNSTRLATPRVLANWGDDVAPVLEHLGVDRFSVAGYSGGGPHALAIATSDALRDRVEHVTLLASIAPDQPERGEHGAEIQRRVRAMSWDEFEGWFESDIMNELDNVAPADTEAFADPEFMSSAMATITEGLKQGSAGDASDQWAIVSPWGFEVADVQQPVDLWHGDADTVVPLDHARILAAALPRSSLHVMPDDGHFSLARHLPAVFQELANKR